MVDLAKIFPRLLPFKALVLGDFVIDAYTTGKVKRISPEAPVPVLEVKSEEERPGGAGNVVLNLLALGASVTAVGRVGDDAAGIRLQALLRNANTSAILAQKNYPTPIKNRLIADSQQLLRIDFETIAPISSELENEIIAQLPKLIDGVQVVAISDYGKGFLSNRLIQTALQICKKKKIPAVVDPKGIDFTKYKGATVLKPNLSEAIAAAKVSPHSELSVVAAELLEFCETLLITRSEAGISIFNKNGRADFPVRFREVKDVTGAGDTVLAMICLALANGLDMATAAQLANIAAGLAIERLGCVQITLPEIANRLIEYTSGTKIVDEGHHFVLKEKSYSLLALEKGQEMTNALFKAICDLSKQKELIIYAPVHDDLIPLLSSLREVSYIITQQKILQGLRLQELYGFKEGKLTAAKELLASLLANSACV